MRKLLWAVLLSAVCSFGADLAGKWRGGFEFKTDEGEDHRAEALLIIKQDGETLTGTAGPNEQEQKSLDHMQFSGDTLTFTVDTGDGAILTVTLKLEGKKLSGKMEGEHDGHEMKAKIDLEREG